ncbi:AAA family ATPase [Roseobacter sp. HKCCA0434]|uniref:AAA family ATPase n=1 Tax=Roseobacter sp. HKCCA0434 TaxID=3079297 RepID=UPI002905A0EC|nr:AAA family ATPase [Roseobacter sp. HKCCA0434]
MWDAATKADRTRDGKVATYRDAIVMQADLVGFSTLAAQLDAKGPRGAEELSAAMARYFDAVIGAVEAHDGKIIGFAGDAILALWQGDAEAARSATAAAHAALTAPLTCRISLARGGVDLICHTGADGSELWLAEGSAVAEAARLNGQAMPGRTVDRIGGSGVPGDPLPVRPRHDRTPLARSWARMWGTRERSGFRDVTVLSCNLSDACGGTGPALDRALEICAIWGGIAVNMLSERKGIVFHVLFGLPPLGPAGRESRALQAAGAIAAELGCAIGVASGRMFLTAHGHDESWTVSAIGSPSALATRLMERAERMPLVDMATAERADDAPLRPPRPIDVKGWVRPIDVMSLDSQPARGERELCEGLAAWLERGCPGEIGITGPRGIGRTHQLRALGQRAREDGWSVLEPVLRPDGTDNPFDAAARLAASVLDDASIKPDLPAEAAGLLATLDPLKGLFPAIDTASGTAESRSVRIEKALTRVLSQWAEGRHALILIDDAHQLDAASRIVLDALVARGVSAALTYRTDETGAVGEDAIRLSPLDLDASDRLVSQTLGSPRCERDTLVELHKRSGGNPLYLKELSIALNRSGELSVSGGALRLPTTGMLESDTDPRVAGTLGDLTTGRLDRLSAESRQMLSVAAVIGNDVQARVLFDLGPGADPTATARTLVQDGLLEETADGFRFASDLVRDVSYSALPYEDRRKLHLMLAETDDLASAARHWAGADRPREASACHAQLAREAAALFAHDAAMSHAAAARAIAGRTGSSLPPDMHADLLMIEGFAALEAVELRLAESRLLDLLDCIGHPRPRSQVRQAGALVGALARQIRHRVGSPRPANIRQGDIAAMAHKNLAEIYYFDGRLGDVLLHTLQSLNLAERIGRVPEMVAGYAALSIGFETSSLAPLADYYDGRARDTAEERGEDADRAFAALVSQVLHAGRGDWQTADAAARRAMTLYDRIGALGRWRQAFATHLHMRLARGALRPEDPDLISLVQGIDRRASAQIRVWVQTARVGAALDADSPIPDESGSVLAGLVDHPQLNSAERLLTHAALAVIASRKGDAADAQEHVDKVLRLARERPPAAWHLATPLAWTAGLCVSEGWMPQAREAARILRRFSRKVPIARPAATYYDATVRKRTDPSARLLQKSTRLASIFGVPGPDTLSTRFGP